MITSELEGVDGPSDSAIGAAIVGSSYGYLITRWTGSRAPVARDEDVPDLGCGSGLLVGASLADPEWTATGVDVWHARDQAGSSRQQCLDKRPPSRGGNVPVSGAGGRMKDARRSGYTGHIFPPARIVTATTVEATV